MLQNGANRKGATGGMLERSREPATGLDVTDPGDWVADDGVILRIAPGGGTTVWSAEPHRYPNGCCMRAMGDALLMVESRARRVVCIPIQDDGSAGPMETRGQPSGLPTRRHRPR